MIVIILAGWLLAQFVVIPWFKASKKATIEVQTYITTKGGDTIKLGNSAVSIMDEKALKEFVELWNNWQKNPNTNPLQRAGIEKAVNDLRSATFQERRTAAYSSLKVATLNLFNDYDDNRLNSFHQQQAKYAHAYTDADGKAALAVTDTSKTYYVIAYQERLVGGTTEKYRWIERVNPERSQTVKLSNFNLWSVDDQGLMMGFRPPVKLPEYPELFD